jgi:hypothetical protein
MNQVIKCVNASVPLRKSMHLTVSLLEDGGVQGALSLPRPSNRLQNGTNLNDLTIGCISNIALAGMTFRRQDKKHTLQRHASGAHNVSSPRHRSFLVANRIWDRRYSCRYSSIPVKNVPWLCSGRYQPFDEPNHAATSFEWTALQTIAATERFFEYV